MPTAKAGAECQVPVPSSQHGGRRGRWGQARQMGGRRGWSGQARPMGATSHRPHTRARQHRTLEKPLGQIPSQHSPFGARLSKRNKTKETNKNLRSSSEFQIPLNPNPMKIHTNQYISKESPNNPNYASTLKSTWPRSTSSTSPPSILPHGP